MWKETTQSDDWYNQKEETTFSLKLLDSNPGQGEFAFLAIHFSITLQVEPLNLFLLLSQPLEIFLYF